MAVVYTHTREDTNEVFYVGVGKKEHRAYSKHNRNDHWRNVVSKVGGFLVNITHRDICYDEALCIEKYLICFYGRADFNAGPLVNKTDGGDGVENPSVRLSGPLHPNYGKKASDEVRAKLKAAAKLRPPVKKETLLKRSAIFSGSRNPMYGRTGVLSPLYGVKKTEEQRRKLSEAKKGKPCPGMAGKNNPNYGKCGGKNPAAKPVIDLDSGKIYECALYAARELGMAATTLRNMLNGSKKNKTSLKYI